MGSTGHDSPRGPKLDRQALGLATPLQTGHIPSQRASGEGCSLLSISRFPWKKHRAFMLGSFPGQLTPWGVEAPSTADSHAFDEWCGLLPGMDTAKGDPVPHQQGQTFPFLPQSCGGHSRQYSKLRRTEFRGASLWTELTDRN